MTTITDTSNYADLKDAPVFSQLIPKLLMKDIVFRNECQRFKVSSLQQLAAFSLDQGVPELGRLKDKLWDGGLGLEDLE
ncbi:hypothetical protein CDAR_85661 [Caerostris darwini]|uniref:Uncharacterized protein n=1 Tax=Caerostris darwini TaxID=1538125 RepID=A0AAV4QEG5_9ARAC|nr:hypothetical protein CDAR_85661 [Caerostris darwini]